MTLLAQSNDEPVTSELIAGSINTNLVFIRHVMGSLSRAGLVASPPGVGEGWRLVRQTAAVEDGALLLERRIPIFKELFDIPDVVNPARGRQRVDHELAVAFAVQARVEDGHHAAILACA